MPPPSSPTRKNAKQMYYFDGKFNSKYFLLIQKFQKIHFLRGGGVLSQNGGSDMKKTRIFLHCESTPGWMSSLLVSLKHIRGLNSLPHTSLFFAISTAVKCWNNVKKMYHSNIEISILSFFCS